MCTAFTCSVFKLTHSSESKSCPQAQLDHIAINAVPFPKLAKTFSVPTSSDMHSIINMDK